MGYTHYWTFKPAPRGKANQVELKYQLAIKECAKLARVWNDTCKAEGRDWERLSGYTAHVKPGAYGGIHLNGKGPEAHEDFIMREHFNQNEGFNFCKTARKPYDTVITACLAVFKYRLGECLEVSSDGNAEDWDAGVTFARTVLKRKVPNPIAPSEPTDFEFKVKRSRKG